MTATNPDHDDPRDYEATAEARLEAYAERRLTRMDRQFGRVEDWRPERDR